MGMVIVNSSEMGKDELATSGQLETNQINSY